MNSLQYYGSRKDIVTHRSMVMFFNRVGGKGSNLDKAKEWKIERKTVMKKEKIYIQKKFYENLKRRKGRENEEKEKEI